jgi:hypothetical protein
MKMISAGRVCWPGGRRLTAGAIAVLSVVGVLGVFPPAVQASPSLAPTWTRQAPASSPPARADAAIAYDAATGTVVLFGGYTRTAGGVVAFGDTWTWDGSTWTKQNPAAHPGGLTVAAMAYDAATRTAVLFGGVTSRGRSGLTWTWDGSTWTKQAPASHPSARYFAPMAYDAATRNVVLFGGVDGRAIAGDTWTWDGSNWTMQAPAVRPPNRSAASMAYDAATRTVVLFGGANNSRGALSDTWTWDGSTWARQNPAAHPSVRASAAMAYDVATGNVVLSGGVGTAGDSVPFGDTWIWG